MAIALEEIAAGVVDSTVGPWALVLGAGAVALAFAARPAQPISRLVAGGVLAMDGTGRIAPRRWFGALRQGVRDLVDEARTEYEAGRRRPGPPREALVGVVNAAAPAPARETEHVLSTPEAGSGAKEPKAGGRRDARGRFVPRSRNGTASE